MKIKKSFVLRKIVGENIVFPIGENNPIKGIISLNETASFFWNLMLEKDVDINFLLESLLHEYDVDKENAINDINAFIDICQTNGILE